MAVDAAHLTSTISEDDRPSIFDIVAQESMLRCLQPAVEHITNILAIRKPEWFGKFHKHCKEVYAILALFLEHHYLKNYNGSFSENFYGLKRVPLSYQKWDKVGLPMSQHVRSLFCLVAVPYIISKLKEKYENDFSADSSTISGRIRLTVFPFIHFLDNFSKMGCLLAYVLGKLNFHSPLMFFSGCRLSNLSEEDITLFNDSTMSENRTILQRFTGTISTLLAVSVSCSLFLLQFLDWWYSNEQSKSAKELQVKIPAPPSIKSSQEKNTCPLCLNNLVAPTCLAVSGYVFCFNCIESVVSKRGKCPLTDANCSIAQLIRINV